MRPVVREGFLDLLVIPEPGLSHWPSIGARTLVSLATELKLPSAFLGTAGLSVKGVLPFEGTGGIVVAQDSQQRVHRIRARSIVKFGNAFHFFRQFEGSESASFIPLKTAERLIEETRLSWDPHVAIIGVNNRSLNLASRMIEKFQVEVTLIEDPEYPNKHFWEVEKRHFEALGGKIILGKPVRLTPKNTVLSELRITDSLGTRVLVVSRVIEADFSFREKIFREYPKGSFLYEFMQTSHELRFRDVRGYDLEETLAMNLVLRLVKNLNRESNEIKDRLSEIQKLMKYKQKKLEVLSHDSFELSYSGKWLSEESLTHVKHFAGVPRFQHTGRKIASIECIQENACNLCEIACPESAIQIDRSLKEPKFLIESLCTGCGKCLTACPSNVPVLVQLFTEKNNARVTLASRSEAELKVGDHVVATNRKGESLVHTRIATLQPLENAKLIEFEIPENLLWQARSFRKKKTEVEKLWSEPENEVTIQLNGQKRLVKENISLLSALFEMGHARSSDVLFCKDGSCQLCTVKVDGVKHLACQMKIRKGMSVEYPSRFFEKKEESSLFCRCMGLTNAEIDERISVGKLNSVQALKRISHVTEGRCHGQLCRTRLIHKFQEKGLELEDWVDWDFPWVDWVIGASTSEDPLE